MRQNRVMMGVPGVFVWLSYIWRGRAIWEVVFSGTAIFLSFSHTHKFNLHFLRRHVAQIEYSKKVWKNDFSAASWHSHLRRYFAVSFCRGTMGWRGSAAGAVVEGKKKKKRTERKAVADFQQADFIWFHQTLTADRPSRCRSLTGLPVDMYSTSRVSGGLTATSSPALFGLATTAASLEWIKITREAFDLI